MPPEEGLMVTPKVLLLWGSLDSSIVLAVLSPSTKETASAWSSSLSRSDRDRPTGQPVSWFWVHLYLFEPIPGSTHDLRHSQVLPFPSAMSAKSGHHPGECKFQILHWLIDVNAELGKTKWSISSVQFLACLAQLPPPINTTDILWLSCFTCPLLRYAHTQRTLAGICTSVVHLSPVILDCNTLFYWKNGCPFL